MNSRASTTKVLPNTVDAQNLRTFSYGTSRRGEWPTVKPSRPACQPRPPEPIADGLDERPRRAKLFYGMITLSTLVGMLINFVGINPMTALFWTAVVNGFLAPPILVVVMLIANNKSVLGEHVNGPVSNAIGWATTVVMSVAAIALALAWGR